MLDVYSDPLGVTSQSNGQDRRQCQRSQTTCRHAGKNCCGSLLRGSVVSTKFLLVKMRSEFM